jgi:hypothetical protein
MPRSPLLPNSPLLEKSKLNNRVKTVKLSKETIPCQASKEEGVTTIPKGSTGKCPEVRGIRKDDEIVCSTWQHVAGRKAGQGLTTPAEHMVWQAQAGPFEIPGRREYLLSGHEDLGGVVSASGDSGSAG